MALVEELESLAKDQTLAEVLALRPQILAQLVDHALARAEYGRHQEAEELLEAIGSVDTRSAIIPFLLGTVRASCGDHAGAVLAYTESLSRDLAVTADPNLRAEALLLRAQANLQLDRVLVAREDLELAAQSALEHVQSVAQASLGALEEVE